LSVGRARASLGAVLFFALLVASLAVAVLVVRARSPDLILEVTSLTCAFEPGTPNGIDEASANFFVRESDPHAIVSIVDSEESVVSVLDEDVALRVGEHASYTWDGRADDGQPAPPGRYRISVELPAAERMMIWPDRVILGSAGALPDRCEPEPGEGES